MARSHGKEKNMDGNNSYNSLLAEVRWYFAQSVFNTSCFYSAVNRCEMKKSNINKWTLAFSILAVISVFLQLISLKTGYNGFITCVSYFSLLVSAGSMINQIASNKTIDNLIIKYKIAAEEYKSLRESFMNLIRIIYQKGDSNFIGKQCESYLEKYKQIGKMSPDTTKEDYKKAQDSLGLKGTGESFTWSDEQIDRLLPTGLKLDDYKH